MSELTQCNFCSYRDIKIRAKARGMKVVKCPNMGYGGYDILVVPKNVSVPKDTDEIASEVEFLAGAESERKSFRDKYFAAWFMELTNSCVC